MLLRFIFRLFPLQNCTGKETDSLSNGLICIDSVWWKGCMCERPFRRGTSSRHHSALKPANLLQIQVAWGTRTFLWMMLTIPHGISTLKFFFMRNDYQRLFTLGCFKGVVHPKIHSQVIQDVNEIVCSSEQIWRTLVLHLLLTNRFSAVNGCRQNESPNSW